MFYLPLYHHLQGQKCLVIGAGQTALRKLRWLLRAGADVTVMAPVIEPKIQAMADAGELHLQQAHFHPEIISSDLRLVICATDAPDVSEQAHARAVQLNVLVNCVDRTELCTVIFPAIIDRMPILVAVSSMGRSPTLTRTVRGWIELRLHPQLGRLAELAGRLRDEVKQRFQSVDSRKAFWEEVFSSSAASEAIGGSMDKAVSSAKEMMASGPKPGSIVLVGAGPGDPDLITIKGLRAIQSADVLMYDKLTNPALLEYARRDVELIDVGKVGPREDRIRTKALAAQETHHGQIPTTAVEMDNETIAGPRASGTAMQARINDTLIEHAKLGKKVVRLKGGDPFIFGRGGEELLVAAEHGIAAEVVPGISAGFGAASIAGIPLTHRHVSQSVRIVTGHRVNNTEDIDWPELARAEQTLVIYMGLVSLPRLLTQLIRAGRAADTPAVVIENATLEQHREIYGVLADLAAKVDAADVDGPSIIIIGEVVALAKQTQSAELSATTGNLSV